MTQPEHAWPVMLRCLTWMQGHERLAWQSRLSPTRPLTPHQGGAATPRPQRPDGHVIRGAVRFALGTSSSGAQRRRSDRRPDRAETPLHTTSAGRGTQRPLDERFASGIPIGARSAGGAVDLRLRRRACGDPGAFAELVFAYIDELSASVAGTGRAGLPPAAASATAAAVGSVVAAARRRPVAAAGRAGLAAGEP